MRDPQSTIRDMNLRGLLVLLVLLSLGGAKIVGNDIPYVPNGDKRQKLDLVVPASAEPVPLVVWIHGGGWMAGSRKGGPQEMLVQNGYAVASIGYRFSQQATFPTQIQDCQAAIRYLRASASQYNIDPDRIGVWGASAGGHLASLLGTAGGQGAFAAIGGNEKVSDRVQAVCNYFGPTDFSTVAKQAAEQTEAPSIYRFDGRDPYTRLLGVQSLDDKAKTAAVSPMHYVSKDDPPFLIVHGTRDRLVPYAQSEQFAAALKGVGVDVILQKVPGGGHGGEAFESEEMQKLVVRFFDKHLKSADVKVEPVGAGATTRTAK